MSDQTPLKTIDAKPLAAPPDVAPSSEVGQMMRIAVEKGDVEVIRELRELYERGMAIQAERQHNKSLMNFQRDCPVVMFNRDRGDPTKSGTMFRGAYADLNQILATLQGPLWNHGLAFSFDTEIDEHGRITALGILKHVDGHKVVARIPAPVRQETKQVAAAQMVSGAITTACRTLMRMMLGMRIEDPHPDDIDAANVITEDQAREMNDLIVAISEYRPMNAGQLLAFYGVSKIAELPASVFNAAMGLLAKRLAERKAEAAKT